mmetsp:Transcript_40166/g.63765  ORF Transcript_40166/g.63765 Transcript_40166/m.63765 type:complete len:338 (-) Transcript_40166:15-1028(-)
MSDHVERVKQIQRTDQVGRAAWGKYCEGNANSVRDPMKHDAQFLQDFITQYEAGAFAGIEVPDVSMGGAPLGLASLFRESQRAAPSFRECWNRYQGRRGAKMNDPMKAEKDVLVQFLEFIGIQGLMALSMMDHSNNYGSYGSGGGKSCGSGAGGNMGWNGPPANSTGEACWSSGGADGMGWQGAPVASPGEACWSASGESWGSYDSGYAGGCDGGFSGASYSSNSGSGCGMSGPPCGGSASYASSWGQKGMPAAKRQKGMPASTGDPYKDALVEKIKEFQRCGDEQKQAWWNFADSHHGKFRDPARLEVPALQMFLSTYGIELPAQQQQQQQLQQQH